MKYKTLINLNVPVELRTRFDMICHASGKTRTAVLINLMEDYVLSQGPAMIELKEKFAEIDRKLANLPIPALEELIRRNLHAMHRMEQTFGAKPEDDEEPLPIFFSDGHEDW